MGFYNCFCNFNFRMPFFGFGWSPIPNFFSCMPRFNFHSYPTFFYQPYVDFSAFSQPNFYEQIPTFNNFTDISLSSIDCNSVFASNTNSFDYYSGNNYSGSNYYSRSYDFSSGFSYNTDTFVSSSSMGSLGSVSTSSSTGRTSTTSSSYSSTNAEKSTSGKVTMRERTSKTVFTYASDKDIYESTNRAYLQDLTPEMQDRTKQLIAYANSKGYDVEITSGYRTPEKQAELREKYKNEPGRVAKNSAHCAGKAVDISVYKNGVKSDEGYNLLGQYAKSELGMRWGGDFSTYRERWHFDYDWA